MGITLNNMGDGGTVNITLANVTRYAQSKTFQYAYYKIPGKPTPTIDNDTYVVSPKKYMLSGLITSAEKIEILALEQEGDKTVLFSDNEITNKSVKLSDINADAKTGFLDYPWRLSISVTATDH